MSYPSHSEIRPSETSTPMPPNFLHPGISTSKLLRSRPHIQFMNPQITLLLAQPQVRLAHTLGSHLHSSPHLLPIRALLAVRDATIRNRMHDVHSSRRILPRQTLRQHPHARPPSAVRGVV